MSRAGQVSYLVLSFAAGYSFAALPPKYLEVADFKQCLQGQEMGTYSAWCLPAEKLQACPVESWEKLQALTGTDKLPDCPSGADAGKSLPVEQ